MKYIYIQSEGSEFPNILNREKGLETKFSDSVVEQKERDRKGVIDWASSQLKAFNQWDRDLARKVNTKGQQNLDAGERLGHEYSAPQMSRLRDFGIKFRNLVDIHDRKIKAVPTGKSSLPPFAQMYSYNFVDTGGNLLIQLEFFEQADFTNWLSHRSKNSESEKYKRRLHQGEILSIGEYVKKY